MHDAVDRGDEKIGIFEVEERSKVDDDDYRQPQTAEAVGMHHPAGRPPGEKGRGREKNHQRAIGFPCKEKAEDGDIGKDEPPVCSAESYIYNVEDDEDCEKGQRDE